MQNEIIQNELDRVKKVYDYYSMILNNTDLTQDGIADHIINIRHYIDLLYETIEEFNNYLNMNEIPICEEQQNRDKEYVTNKKNLANILLLYSFINSNE